jgi:hypothetical protein
LPEEELKFGFGNGISLKFSIRLEGLMNHLKAKKGGMGA